MHTIKPNSGITIAGIRQYGKTTFAKHLIRKFVAAGVHVVIYDPLRQYTEFNSHIPQYFGTASQMAEFDSIAGQIWQQHFDAYYNDNSTAQKPRTMLVVEECENFIGQGMAKSAGMVKIVNMGGNVGIGYTAITRRISNLDKTVFSLSDNVFIFRFFSNNDIKYCAEFLPSGYDALLPKLTVGEYLHYKGDGSVIRCAPIALR